MKGFPEGTSHITTGDRIKDSRRSKFKCVNYSNGNCLFSGMRRKNEPVWYNENGVVCAGSAHCLRYKERKQNKPLKK